MGDTPLIGCGTYADDLLGACSCTGLEAIIKSALARHALELCAGGKDPNEVVAIAVKQLKRFGGDGGLILVDAKGRVGFAFDTARMARTWIVSIAPRLTIALTCPASAACRYSATRRRGWLRTSSSRAHARSSVSAPGPDGTSAEGRKLG